jgi:hypothetical protein
VLIAAAVEESLTKSLKRASVDQKIATFYATIPAAGVKTNKDNEWVLTMHVAWEDRLQVSRVIDHIPMVMKVRIEVVTEADD